MLKKLSVRNFVLIDELEINFHNGLTIITGETGAGKSILLGALNLILGQRADSQSLLVSDRKCVVEALFDISGYELEGFFEQHDLDYENESTVRREINPEGKSRAFINDTPVTLAVLKALTSRLVDIHSQHETILINQPGFQLEVVDAYAKNKIALSEYSALYKSYRKVQQELKEALDTEQKSKSEADYFKFQLNEFLEAALSEDEQEKLEEEQDRLSHAEEISLQNNQALNLLNEGEENLVSQLSSIKQILTSLSRFGSPYKELLERVNFVQIEIKDIASELQQAGENSAADPHRLIQLQERLSLIYRLQQKHRVDSIKELLEISSVIDSKLQSLDSLEDQILNFRKQEEQLQIDLLRVAQKLSAKRREAAPEIEKEIVSILADLAMPHARLKIEFSEAELQEFYTDGRDRVRFMLAANKGKEFREIQKSASGGELSRIMLSIKALQAKLTRMPTVIFDEIDAGISGETAAKTALILLSMSKQHQVFSITHLPQIAARGTKHFFVFKEIGKQHTRTRIKELNEDERVKEVARMLSGESLSEAALSNARELLSAV